jgi:hypothetical protein
MVAGLVCHYAVRIDPVAEKSNSASTAIGFGTKTSVPTLRQNEL